MSFLSAININERDKYTFFPWSDGEIQCCEEYLTHIWIYVYVYTWIRNVVLDIKVLCTSDQMEKLRKSVGLVREID